MVDLLIAPYEVVEAVLEAHRTRARRRLDRLNGHQIGAFITIVALALAVGAAMVSLHPAFIGAVGFNTACSMIALTRWERAGLRAKVAMKSWGGVIAQAMQRRGRRRA